MAYCFVRFYKNVFALSVLALATASASGCGSSGEGTPGGSGAAGSAADTSNPPQGGAPAAGGGVGGNSGAVSGGSGGVSTGGTGAAAATGGTGGTAATGGNSATGGTGATAATGGTGAAAATGGTGAAAATGGNSATGGTAATGGTGAAAATGGNSATGGTGATAATGGTGGTAATGGTSATGGTAATGGDGGTGGTTPNMRDVPSTQIVEEMFLGWNLGNTLDSDPDETAWGNPPTSQAMMDAVHEAGFNTVRIPVTWAHHMGGAPDYAVDAQWMDRVEEVANYVLSTGMYAIINTHHDEWVSLMPSADHEAVATQLGELWTQIATRFRDYGDHLIFETLNEPRTTDDTQWSGGTPEARGILNDYNLAAVNAIRATGGNNAIRHIMIPTHAANPDTTCIEDLDIPNDDPKIIVSLHTYYPNDFSFGNSTSWDLGAGLPPMEAELDRIYDLLPRNGRAVVIGEWGTVNQDNTSVRATHAETYARLVRERGMCPIWWDNGAAEQGANGFGLLDRDALPPGWYFPEIVAALVNGATAGAQ